MRDACLALDFPVVSGNVSLYNETDGAGIPPTPTIGAVGLLDDYARRADYASLADGDCLLLLGVSHGELGQSLYLRECLGRSDGAPPPVDLAAERRVGDFVRAQIQTGAARTVHDLSDGGLIVAAAEMALASNVGVTLDATSRAHAHILLFGEDQGRYLVATREPERIIALALAAHVNVAEVGDAGGREFSSKDLFSIPLDDLRAAHEGWLPALMT
jgi:phosphoribosylformylglycinamidine synthase